LRQKEIKIQNDPLPFGLAKGLLAHSEEFCLTPEKGIAGQLTSFLAVVK
jgi:hypothetical protein